MPNWCYNTLLIEAEPQVISKIKAQLSAPYTTKYDDTGIVDVQKDLSFWNIIRPPADKMDEYHGTHGYTADGKVGDTEFNWYNWNIYGVYYFTYGTIFFKSIYHRNKKRIL